MAKRYIRINWQNAPSVATPRNAENLNIMDKGIDDLDLFKVDTDAIVNNGVTTVAGTVLDGRMGKNLQDQITEQNNNLANQYYKVYSAEHKGSAILITAGGFITGSAGTIPRLYLVTITDSSGLYYCGLHFFVRDTFNSNVVLGGTITVATNNMGTISPSGGTAPYKFTISLLSTKN